MTLAAKHPDICVEQNKQQSKEGDTVFHTYREETEAEDRKLTTTYKHNQ